MKKTLYVLLLVAILGGFIHVNNANFVKAEVAPLSPSVIYVPGDYSTIQEAINAANSGDTIIVANGTYKEQVTINKSLRLIGENRSNTIIDANGANFIVKIIVSNVTLSGFTVQNASFEPTLALGGILLQSSTGDITNITISDCIIQKCLWGVRFWNSYNNTFRRNKFVDTSCFFEVTSFSNMKYFYQDIDNSNTINDRPIYWWINQHNLEVPPDAGAVVALNCTNITIKDAGFPKEGCVVFVGTNNSIIENVSVSSGYRGISLSFSSNNTIRNNTVFNISFTGTNFGISLLKSNNNKIIANNVSCCNNGIKLRESNNSIIQENIITYSRPWSGIALDVVCNNNVIKRNIISFNEQDGMLLDDNCRWNKISENIFSYNTGSAIDLSDGSRDNLITENTFSYNAYGIRTASLENQITCKSIIYKNNFMHNQFQFSNDIYTKNHTWDNGAEGNYWSNFAGVDANKDGISDIAYSMDANNIDHYPLMEPWSRSRIFNVTFGEVTFHVNIFSNSTIGGFCFNSTKLNPHIAFNVTGPVGAKGFCNVTIPKLLLNVTIIDEWVITIDGGFFSTLPIISENATHTFFYLIYECTTHKIRIRGTNAYPEFPFQTMLLLIFFFATLGVGILRRKMH